MKKPTKSCNKNPEDIFSVKGKVIVITGGAGLLGSSYVEVLRDRGAEVIIWDMMDGSVDITDEKVVQKAVADIIKKHGKIDVLINNAALNPAVGSPEAAGQFVPYEKYPIDLWEKELKVNLTGTMICTKAVTAAMIQKKSGSIINVASDLSVIAHDHRVYNDPEEKRFKSIAYTTTKSALLGFTRQWAARLGKYNIRVNTFSPTGVETPAQDREFIKRFGAATMFGRMAKPGDYAGAILFLSSDASAFMTGHNLVVDGGKTVW